MRKSFTTLGVVVCILLGNAHAFAQNVEYSVTGLGTLGGDFSIRCALNGLRLNIFV